MKAISLLLLVVSGCAPTPRADQEGNINQVRRQLRQCYEESDSLRKRGAEDRSIEVQVLISEQGFVKGPKIIRSDFKDSNLHACVLGIVKKIKYPPQKGSVDKAHILPIDFILVNE
jgi:hypothetical protein